MRHWTGDRAPIVGTDMTIPLSVQRDPDQGTTVDDPIPFGLAVTLTMPESYKSTSRFAIGLGLAFVQRRNGCIGDGRGCRMVPTCTTQCLASTTPNIRHTNH